MKIYNKEKTEILPEDFDFSNGSIVADTLITKIPSRTVIVPIYEFQLKEKLENGSRVYEKVLKGARTTILPEKEIKEEILVFIPKE